MLAITGLGGRVLGLDRDKDQIKRLNQKIGNEPKITLVVANFSTISQTAKKAGFYPVDGILFDLGLSMTQLTVSGKGLSYKKLNEPLDMRLDDEEEETASDLLNSLGEEDIYNLLAKNSEEPQSRTFAEGVVRARKLKRIKTVGDLIEIINSIGVFSDEKTLARIFQALRMAVNHERESLDAGLRSAYELLKPEGRMVVITFHSVEDRWVKRFIQENKLKTVTKKPVRDKISRKFSRSAKMRIIIK